MIVSGVRHECLCLHTLGGGCWLLSCGTQQSGSRLCLARPGPSASNAELALPAQCLILRARFRVSRVGCGRVRTVEALSLTVAVRGSAGGFDGYVRDGDSTASRASGPIEGLYLEHAPRPTGGPLREMAVTQEELQKRHQNGRALFVRLHSEPLVF